jgi:IclR family acetate operon transcriptional repressor
MTGVLERTLAVLEKLAAQAEAMPLAVIADELDIPKSACHRLLSELVRHGYVRQVRQHGDYVLTTKLIGLGLSFLANTGIVDIAQTMLDRLAELSGELVRLAIVDEDSLTWVAKAQGARKGLRYDPDMGMNAKLSCSATGHAWMLTMSDERALKLISQQGFGSAKDFGPNAPTTVKQILDILHAGRDRGYAAINEVFAPGMTAMAAPVQKRGYPAIGVISIAGPLVRLDEKRMHALGPALLAAASELAAASSASTLFNKPFLNNL